MPEALEDHITPPENPRTFSGVNIISVTDTDGQVLFLAANRDLDQAANPANAIKDKGKHIDKPSDFPLPLIVDPEEYQRERQIQFINQTNLPIAIATYLALNTEEPLENWQFLPQPVPCIAIVGMAEVGKTTYTQALAKVTNSPVLDMELFDQSRPDRPQSVKQAFQSLCDELQQRRKLHKLDPDNNPLPTMILLDANGMGWWDDRPINQFDFISHMGAELRIHILTVKDLPEPQLIRNTREIDIPNLGPIGVSGLIYLQTADIAENNPQIFVNKFLGFKDNRGQSVVEMGQASRDGFIFASPWWDGN